MTSSKKQKVLAVLLATSLIAGTTATMAVTVSAEDTSVVAAQNGDLVDSIELKTDGTSCDGTITSFEDYQYYKVVIEEDGAFTVNFTNSNPNLSATLKSTLYNEDFSVEYATIENRTDSTPKTKSNTYYLYKGTYYLKVSAKKQYIGDEIKEPTAYKINSVFESANSNVNTPNESPDKAMEIEINTKYNSIIEEQENTCWYKFTINKKAKYTFVNTSQIYWVRYCFRDKDQIELKWCDLHSPAGSCNIELNEGTYFISVEGATSGSDAGIYSFYYYETEKGDPFVHTHSFGDEWKSDETNHWHECTADDCDEKADVAEHTFAWITDKEATATEEGLRHQECTVCGYKGKSEIVPITGPDHIHSYGEEWKSDKTNHWHECTVCGEKADVAEHTFGDWIIDKEATDTETGLKHKECTVCGYEESEIIPVTIPTPDPKPNPNPTPTPTPSNTDNNGKSAGKSVSTGDSTLPITIASVLGLGAISAFVITYKKKHN